MKRIPLTKGLSALVSDQDFSKVNKHKWTATKNNHHHTWYAHRSVKIERRWKKITLHRFLMGFPIGLEVDHRDGNGLNNVRSNLRICTASQNKMNMRISNKRGFKGVTFIPNRKLPWRVGITKDRIAKHVGYYASLREAAMAYNKAAKKLFGKFARLNIIPSH